MCSFVDCKQGVIIYIVCASNLDSASSTSFPRRLNVTFIHLTHDTDSSVVIEVLLPQLQICTMGTNCSYNFYDSRQWSSLEHGNSEDTSKLGKRMRYFRKRAQSDPTSETSQSTTELCNCHQRLNNHTPDEHLGTVFLYPANVSQLSANLKAPLSPSEFYETAGNQVRNNRLFPNINGVGHMKLSRIFGSGKDNPKHNVETSPQRLLTRRCHSPSYRAAGYNSRPSFGSPAYDRQRSLSWSNGKIGTKDYLKTSSPTLKTSSVCSSLNHRGNPVKTHGSMASKQSHHVSTMPHSPMKSPKCDSHHPECPLHIKSRDTKQSTRKQQLINDDLEEDWTPITRRRANSESHTTHLHRHLPRSLESAEISHSHEHAHVHWADEESGSSLSTSVFLSSIRPRSYSQGAVDSPPHRPILKKLLG